MNKKSLLWVDDEVEMLQPHVLFLEKKGYKLDTCHNGIDAISLVKENDYDLVLLDENMPGMSGIEVLEIIKENKPSLPVVMVTKSEQENIMEEAIGSKITDYLIKPVNPNQILISLKKILESTKFVAEKTIDSYRKSFQELNTKILNASSVLEWKKIYKKILYWELELDEINSPELHEIFSFQKNESNNGFSKFIQNNYANMIAEDKNEILSNTAFKRLVVPKIIKNKRTLLILIDNLRYDQYKVILPKILTHFKLIEEIPYLSILPTTTQYSRNSFFSGMLPLEMFKNHPEWWKNDNETGGKNLFEKDFLENQIKNLNIDIKTSYTKISKPEQSQTFIDFLNNENIYDLSVLVYNFVDMISHSKTEMEVIKELASTDKAYRSLTKSWFLNSSLYEIIKLASEKDYNLIITTDHGTINVETPSKIIGDRDSSSNIRYKTGRRLKSDDKNVYMENQPNKIGLPSINLSSSYVFAKSNQYLIYPSNYNHFVKYYKNTYQHGGISLQEMFIPFSFFSPK